jgi:YidC/Oxa1 family membrane protein insertase
MLVDANIFQPLISVFQSVIYFFHHSVGLSWGWSIILLTICVRMVMIPLTIKQFHSMRRLQMHQPEMKAIQQKYKEDKQRQQQEMMKFYKENNVNPLASCLPMVLQLPVFISLFYMLRKNLRTDICQPIQTAFQKHYAAVQVAKDHLTQKAAHLASLSQTTYCTDPRYAHGPVPGAGFLFIHDITNTAHGATLVVLLILYVATQAVSTLIMSAPTMDKTQRQMMMAMPLLFVLFIIRFPAGLLVYWITTNGWTMVQQFALKRIIGPPPISNPTMIVEEVREAEQGLFGRARGLFGGPGSGSGASSTGSGAANGSARARGAHAAPPPPPRKKKKRSGRRR